MLGPDWRDRMDAVHAATDALLAQERVAISWKGRPLQQRDGPYRIVRKR